MGIGVGWVQWWRDGMGDELNEVEGTENRELYYEWHCKEVSVRSNPYMIWNPVKQHCYLSSKIIKTKYRVMSIIRVHVVWFIHLTEKSDIPPEKCFWLWHSTEQLLQPLFVYFAFLIWFENGTVTVNVRSFSFWNNRRMSHLWILNTEETNCCEPWKENEFVGRS